MSKIDELIKEKCPNGVEYRPLWELTTWDKKFNAVDNSKQPKVLKYYYYLANDLKPLVKDDGNIKILTTNESELFTTEDLVKPGTIAEQEIVAIPWGGNPVVQYYKGKFVTADNRIAISNDTSILDTKFLYYVLINKLDEISSFYRGSGIKHPSMAKVLDLSIPVPPLEVQKEIVGMLNSFTELEAELEAELTKRKQQYEHYRDHLLSFENIAGEGGQVEWLTLGDIAEIGTGSSNTEDAVEDGQYPFFVRSQEPLLKDSYEFDETAIITAGDGVGVGKVFHFVDGKYALHQRAYRIHPTRQDVNAKYLFQLMRAKFYDYISKKGFHSSVSSIRKPMLINFPVPLPKPEIQERIVYVLDNFDAVCNDLKIGLPAEIEARQKQYEYYRDRLLSFDAVVGGGTERERERGVAKLRQYIFGYYITKIEDICDISRGIVMSKDFIKDNAGDYPVYSSQTENDGMLGKINTYKYDGEYLTWTTDGANAGTVFRRSGKFSVTNVCGLLKIKEEDILSDYLYYVLSVEAKKHVNSGMGNPKLMSNVMGSIKVIIPSADKQESIIKVLNSLSEICENFKSGLPAEIEARHKQYEYYRDKLLTFSEK